ncbi:phage baseplate assembly protein V [Pararoseomonas sp. SCSIO 73927]|uniref:phage baseplate assembly protein V n=1 Tax=Pararoseomonas sp. SCSIO 73927 TaxID=3114537 RepID=UPI0030CE7D17
MTPGQFQRLIAPLRRRVMLAVGRAVLHAATDGQGLQKLQVTMLADETREDVDHVQTYGLATAPLAGAHVVVVCVGGSRDHPVAVAVEDPRFRPGGLGAGEVCLYSYQDAGGAGHRVILTGERKIRAEGLEIELKGETKVRVDSPLLECTGEIRDRCESGGVTMADMRQSYDEHGHPDAAAPPSPLMQGGA